MRSFAAVVGVTLLAGLSACGGGGGNSAADAVSKASANLGKIHSGRLHLLLSLQPLAGNAAGIGLALDGPFSLARHNRLPVARVHYRQRAGDRQVNATLVSTGEAAFVQLNGITYQLPPRETRLLESPGGGRLSMSQLHVSRWIRNPRLTHPDAQTDRITGQLDPVSALADVLKATHRPDVPAQDARQLRNAVRTSRVVLITRRRDSLLRSLTAAARIELPPSLRARFGQALGLRIRFELGIDAPNAPVTVTPPPTSQPLR
ncbi:MAG: hypothetical protein M3155_09400 [Actinomycetota bacterium]|nr:hypothetical protein [Actinomycetota bacterium]